MRADASYGVWVRTRRGTFKRKKTHDRNLCFWFLGLLVLAIVASSYLMDYMDKQESRDYTPAQIESLNRLTVKVVQEAKQRGYRSMSEAERGRAIAEALSIDLTKPVELVLEDGRRQ